MVGRHFGHAVVIEIDDAPIMEFHYIDNEVDSQLAIPSQVFTEGTISTIVAYMGAYISRVRSADWLSAPDDGAGITPDHKAEVSWKGSPPDEMTLEVEIGSLAFEAEFALIGRTYTIEMNQAILSWADFIYFYRALRDFVDDCKKL